MSHSNVFEIGPRFDGFKRRFVFMINLTVCLSDSNVLDTAQSTFINSVIDGFCDSEVKPYFVKPFSSLCFSVFEVQDR